MEENTIDLRELANMLLKNLRKICIITGVFVLIAIIYLFRASPPPPMYESDSLLRIKQHSKVLGAYMLQNGTGDSPNMTEQLMSTDAEILKSRSVIEPVIMATEPTDKDGKYPDYEAYVKERITTTPLKKAEILKLSVIAASPEAAQKANKLIVQGFLERLQELSRDEQRVTKDFVAVDMANVEQNKVAEVVVFNEVQLVDAANLPVNSVPVKTRKASLTLMMFLILGLMAGCGYAIAYEMLNRKIRTPEDVQNFLGLTILGSIPDIASMDRALADRLKKPNLYEKIRRLLQK